MMFFLSKDLFLTEAMVKASYRLNRIGETDSGEADQELTRRLEDSPLFAYARLPADDMHGVTFLEKLGFHLVATSMEYTRPAQLTSVFEDEEFRFAIPEDEETIRDIARRTFMHDRFHRDPMIGKNTADRIKCQWAGNYFRGQRGDRMIVALQRSVPVAFLLMLKQGTSWIIDLFAVDEAYRGRSLGSKMIAYAENNCPDLEMISVATQVTNKRAINFYEKLGFKWHEAHYIYHYHN